MTGNDFKRMIDHCIEQYDINDPDKVYVCMQWYDEDNLYPIFCWDCDRKNNISYVISGREPLTYNKYCGPQPIWINKDGYREKEIVHWTWTLSNLKHWIYPNGENANVEFLISTWPQNIIGEINPHRTYMVKNTDGDNFIVFCWDSRDSGEGPNNSAEFSFSRIHDFGSQKTSSPCICDSCDNGCETK